MNRTLQITNRVLAAVVAALILTLLIREYFQYKKDMEAVTPSEYKYRFHKDRYKIMRVAAYNYTDHDIYGVLIFPEDKSDLDYATHGTGSPPARSGQRDWEWHPHAGTIAWDYQWEIPKRFKVWWERVADKELLQANTAPYDQYTSKDTLPGLAWCEGFIILTRTPPKTGDSYIVLHFYPDGRVEADIDGEPRVEINKRHKPSRLVDKACLKQIPNPFYGRKKPIRFN